MNKEKIIELAKELSAYDSNYDNYIMTEQDISIFADELLKAINYSRCCKSDSEQLSCDHRALISIGDGFGNTFCPICKTYNPTT